MREIVPMLHFSFQPSKGCEDTTPFNFPLLCQYSFTPWLTLARSSDMTPCVRPSWFFLVSLWTVPYSKTLSEHFSTLRPASSCLIPYCSISWWTLFTHCAFCQFWPIVLSAQSENWIYLSSPFLNRFHLIDVWKIRILPKYLEHLSSFDITILGTRCSRGIIDIQILYLSFQKIFFVICVSLLFIILLNCYIIASVVGLCLLFISISSGISLLLLWLLWM